jgi:hypothetical protein
MTAVTFEAHEDIRPVPRSERRISAFGIGVLWGDLGVGLLVLAAGGLLVPALGFRDAIFATLIGSAIGSALLAIVGRIGSDTGVPTMVALRPSLGLRGSWLASAMNITQLIGWAGLEIIIMAEATRAISREFFGFDGYYFWLAVFALLATLFAVGGPVVVVRQFLSDSASGSCSSLLPGLRIACSTRTTSKTSGGATAPVASRTSGRASIWPPHSPSHGCPLSPITPATLDAPRTPPGRPSSATQPPTPGSSRWARVTRSF